MINLNDISTKQKKDIENYCLTFNESCVKEYNDLYEYNKSKNINKPFYIAYYNIIKRTADLLSKLDIHDPFSTSVIFQYLLWNGYFSKNHTLVYHYKNQINNPAILGADIMLGESVCLNNAEMLKCILNEINTPAYVIGCNLGNLNWNKIEYIPNIPRNIIVDNYKKQLLTLKEKIGTFIRCHKVANLIGNHVLTLFEFRGCLFLSDPTNKVFLNFSDFLKAEIVGSDYELELKPLMLILYSKLTKEQLDNLIINSFSFSDTKILNVSNIKEISELSLQVCKEKSFLLDKFYQDNEKDIDIVSKTLIK